MAGTGVTAPKGYQASGVACGLKKNGNRDLALICSDVPATCAGIFTTNLVKGHSLQWSKARLEEGYPVKAVAVNSGCANACVGVEGDEDARRMATIAAELASCNAESVLLGSTGVIGFRLDMDKINAGLQQAHATLNHDGGSEAAKAVMTTDTFPKEASRLVTLDNTRVTIGGMAKGSGMIHPNMATMISVVTTDANITREMLQKALKEAADRSFNRVSVDGDTSVCDMVLMLANGLSESPLIESEGPLYHQFLEALTAVCIDLSKMLARDGEGATKLIEIEVQNASDRDTSHKILNAIAKSPLVKTAIFGQDANWGRILTAAGYSGASFDPGRVDIFLGDVMVCKDGKALVFDESAALEILKAPEVKILIDLKSGEITDRLWTCDLTYDYIKINGSYRT